MIRQLFTAAVVGAFAFSGAGLRAAPQQHVQPNHNPAVHPSPQIHHNNQPYNQSFASPWRGTWTDRNRGYIGRGYNTGYRNSFWGVPFGVLAYNSWYVPWSYRSDLYVTPTSTIVNSAPEFTEVPDFIPAPETGLKITDVFTGPARNAKLQTGDIILGVGANRTQSFEELQQALRTHSGQEAEIVFINSETKAVEKIRVTPVDGKIGVSVQPVGLQ